MNVWNIAIVLVGSLLFGLLLFLGLLLVLGVPGLAYSHFFVLSVVLAVIVGLSTPRPRRHPAERRSAGGCADEHIVEDDDIEKIHYPLGRDKGRIVGTAIVILGSLLAASTMLYIALDFDLLREFCIPTYGAVGDVKIDNNDYCNYDYGQMAKLFLSSLMIFLAPFIVFAVLTVTIRALRFSFFPFVRDWVGKRR